MAKSVIKNPNIFLRRNIQFDKVQVPANGIYQYPNKDVSLSGYEFLGITGNYTGTNAGLAVFLCQTTSANSSEVQFGLLNTKGNAIIPNGNPQIQALYRKL